MIPSNRSSIQRAFLGFSGVLLLLVLLVGTSAWTWGHRSVPSRPAEGPMDAHEFGSERDSLMAVVDGLRKKVDALKGNDASKLLKQMEEERLWLSNYVEQFASRTSAGAMRSFAGNEANKPSKSMDEGMLALKAKVEGALLGRTVALEQARAAGGRAIPNAPSIPAKADVVERRVYDAEKAMRIECQTELDKKKRKISTHIGIASQGMKILNLSSLDQCEPPFFRTRVVGVGSWDSEKINDLIEQYRRLLVEVSQE